MPIYQIRQTLPFSEIRLWRAYFKTEYNRHEKIDWYLAQIALAVDRSTSQKKRTYRVKEYLLKFKVDSDEPMTVVQATKRFKMWITGIAGGGKRKKK